MFNSLKSDQSTSLPNLKFMIVEDSPQAQYLLSRQLKKIYPNAEFTYAKDAHGAFRLLDGETPDLVFLDLKLDNSHGHDVLTTLPKKLRSFPIILLTGVIEQREILDAIDMGADGYLPKPINRFNLKNQVAKLLSGSSKNLSQIYSRESLANFNFKTDLLSLSQDGIEFLSETAISQGKSLKIGLGQETILMQIDSCGPNLRRPDGRLAHKVVAHFRLPMQPVHISFLRQLVLTLAAEEIIKETLSCA